MKAKYTIGLVAAFVVLLGVLYWEYENFFREETQIVAEKRSTTDTGMTGQEEKMTNENTMNKENKKQEIGQKEGVVSDELVIKNVVEGTGPEAKVGDTVAVHYTGKLEDGTVFDTSRTRGEPIEFTLGAGRVIAGWEQGILGMKVGGSRTLVIPPALGYGDTGVPGAIPGGATLIFDVELMKIK